MSIRHPRSTLIPACIAIAIGAGAFSVHGAVLAADTIVTDRPDFVESSAVVGKGRLQVETSFAVDRSSANGVRDTLRSTPSLVRFGVTESIELRVESDGAMRQRSRATSDGGAVNATDHGYADASLGLKWHAMDAQGSLPAVGVLLHADMSTGSAAFRDEGTRPSARVVAEWELPNDMSLGVMPGLGYERSNGGTVFGILGVVLGKAWNDNLRSFVEVSSPRIARAQRGGSEAVVTVGAAYLLTPTVQVDTALSRGLNSRTPDFGLTVGLSFKL